MNNTKDIISILKALSCPNRYLIVQFLSKRPRCAGAIATHLGISPGAVSQHLHRLLESRIVDASKCGNYVHYSLNHETLRTIGDQLISISEVTENYSDCKRKEQDCV